MPHCAMTFGALLMVNLPLKSMSAKIIGSAISMKIPKSQNQGCHGLRPDLRSIS